VERYNCAGRYELVKILERERERDGLEVLSSTALAYEARS
jgi:hypothetical protein